jgi:hypothetical protein
MTEWERDTKKCGDGNYEDPALICDKAGKNRTQHLVVFKFTVIMGTNGNESTSRISITVKFGSKRRRPLTLLLVKGEGRLSLFFSPKS